MADIDALVAQLAALTTEMAAMRTANQNAPAHPLPVQPATPSTIALPPFKLNAANPYYAKSWFAQAEIILQLHVQNDPDKVRMVIAALDTPTFDKVRRALLPDDIIQLDDFAKLKKTMTKLFDVEESLFAHRYAALQTEWGGPDKESVREYQARINEIVAAFDIGNFGENELATLIFVMGMKARALEPLRTMCVDALRKNPKIPLKGLAETVAASILTRQEQRLPEGGSSQVNFVKKSNHRMKPKHADNSSNKPNGLPCASCGGNHARSSCRFKDAECRLCKKKGHIAKVCLSSKKREEVKVSIQSKTTTAAARPSVGNVGVYDSMMIASVAARPLPSRMMINVGCNNVQIKAQLDCGSDITILSTHDYKQLESPPFTVPGFYATLANGNEFWIMGAFMADVSIRGQQKHIKVHVADSRVTLIGLDLFDAFNLDEVPLKDIRCNMVSDSIVVAQPVIDKLLQDFDTLFKEGVGKCTKKKIKLHLKQGARPVYVPARRISPYAMEESKAAFDQMVKEDIGFFVQSSPWASPYSMVPKKDGKRRLVVDYSIGLNDQLEEPGYMIPTPNDLFDKLAGCSVFSLLDMSQAYHQIELNESSKVLTTVSTPFGLFRYNTQPFGTKNAPRDFQQTMDEMINEAPALQHSASYFDDIIVFSRNTEEHHGDVRRTLQRFMDWGFRLNFKKCKFYRSSIKFLGKVVDGNGIRPDPDKVAAIQQMTTPTDVSSLRSFLGMVNYYQEFIPMMRDLREPLDNLHKSDAIWEWNDMQNAAVAAIKEKLTQECLLTHYDPRLPITVAADASKHGIGGVISHIYPDGKEKPIQFFSRALNGTQQRYSQTEKEALALIAAVKTFHRYLEGRKFTLLTDHKALLVLFGKKKLIPVLAMNRLHRWALFLAAYDFDIQYRNTSKFGQADALSRLISETKALPELYEEDEDYDLLQDAAVHQIMVAAVQMLPVTSDDIIQAYVDDQEAQKILKNLAEAASPDEKFHLVNKIIMMNNRVYIPQSLRHRILDQLHVGHPGINRMKALARQHVYWQNLTKDVEAVVNQCFGCIQLQKNPVKTTLASWPVSVKPGDRVHMDFAGPILGKMLLIAVDSCSKWMDIGIMNTANSSNTISFMYRYIAANGSPRALVTDNGTQFTSADFSAFCSQNGITHITSPAYHPQSNGQAERMVDTVKRYIRKAIVVNGEGVNLENCVAVFLQAYHTTPSKATPGECTPAFAHLGRELRTSMDMIRPRMVEHLGPDLKMEDQFNRKFGAVKRDFQAPDNIYWRKGKDTAWKPGTIKRKLGSKMFLVEDDFGKAHRLHTNQMIHRFAPLIPENTPAADDSVLADDNGYCTPLTYGEHPADDSVIDHDFDALVTPSAHFTRTPSPMPSPVQATRSSVNAPQSPINREPTPTLRRSTRRRQPPKRLQIDPRKKRYDEL